jgi:hypothetical protein
LELRVDSAASFAKSNSSSEPLSAGASATSRFVCARSRFSGSDPMGLNPSKTSSSESDIIK